jgi:hypothetical protein
MLATFGPTWSRNAMDDAEAATVLFRYMFARAWFRRDNLLETFTGPVRRGLEYEISRGVRLFGGIRIDPSASSVIVADHGDQDFLAAINGGDNAIKADADELDMLRGYVFTGEPPLPARSTGC